MNLIKLFNKDYLKENIKKSKGLIILFLLLVPVFTALVIVSNTASVTNVKVFRELDLLSINIIGMYIIPVVLSFCLFGYIYKRTSVDFINSMPLNRKTIFFTNTIGGILLITLMQIVTAIILILCSAFLGDTIIFLGMVLDCFILMWVSYMFVLLATNVAMAFSGTFLTQIALTMLILFLVPFSISTFNINGRTMGMFENGEKEFSVNVQSVKSNYTMPYRIISMITQNSIESGSIYSNRIISRMIILGVIYYFIGMYLFEKRKMENTEESFQNVKLHLFVKTLTIFPMMVLINLMEMGTTGNIIAIALVVVYFFLFDFALKRKIMFKVSILSLILTLAITQGICSAEKELRTTINESKEVIAKQDIDSVSISYPSGYADYYYSSYYPSSMSTNNFMPKNYYIKNDDLVNLLFEYGYEFKDKTINYINVHYLNLDIKKKNGSTETIRYYISYENFENLLEIFSKDENYMAKVKENLLYSNSKVLAEKYQLTDEEKAIFISEMKNELEKMSLKEIYSINKSSESYIYEYYYNNHKLVSNVIPANINEKIFNMVANKMNSNFYKELESTSALDIVNWNLYVTYTNLDSMYEEQERTYFNYTSDEIIKFLQNNKNEEFDSNKEYYLISGYLSNFNNTAYVFTNKVDEINEIIAKEKRNQQYEDVNVKYID